MKKIKMQMTEQQAKLIQKSLDFYSRVGCLQFQEILTHPSIWKMFEQKYYYEQDGVKYADYNIINEMKDLIKLCFNQIRFILDKTSNIYMSSNSWHGIYSKQVDESCRQSYDILQVIRYQFAKKRIEQTGKKQYTVDQNVCLTSKNVNFNNLKIEILQGDI